MLAVAAYGSSSDSDDSDDGGPSTVGKEEEEEDVVEKRAHALPGVDAALRPRHGLKPDEPEKHGGRTRTVRLNKGSKPCVVFIDAHDGVAGDKGVHRLVRRWRRAVRRHCGADVHLMHEGGGGSMRLHASVSKMFGLMEHQVEPLLAKLRHRLAHLPEFTAGCDGMRVLTNETKARSFLALTVGTGYGKEEFAAVIAAVDDVMKAFQLPVFYQPCVPHVSVAWALGDCSPTGSAMPAAVRKPPSFHVPRLILRVLKTDFPIPLRAVPAAPPAAFTDSSASDSTGSSDSAATRDGDQHAGGSDNGDGQVGSNDGDRHAGGSENGDKRGRGGDDRTSSTRRAKRRRR